MVRIDGKDYADANEYISDQLMALNKSIISVYSNKLETQIYKTEEEE